MEEGNVISETQGKGNVISETQISKNLMGHAPDPPRLTCLTAATYTPPGGGRHFKNLPLVELLLVTPFPKTSIEMLKSFFSMGFFVGGPRRGEIAKRS